MVNVGQEERNSVFTVGITEQSTLLWSHFFFNPVLPLSAVLALFRSGGWTTLFRTSKF